MASTIFWHGTPADIRSSEIEPRPSFFTGIWASSAPEIAAHYAGMEGWVHGFVPAADARFLLATGHRRSGLPFAYPDAATWDRVRDWLVEDQRMDLDHFDCVSESKIRNGFARPLGGDGQPTWEGLLHDLSEVDETSEFLIRRLGLSGVLQSESPDQAMGDRRGTTKCRLHDELLRSLHKVASDPILTLGALDPSALVPVCRLPARGVAQAFLAGHGLPRSQVADLGAWIAADVEFDGSPGLRP